jgi:galactokinase
MVTLTQICDFPENHRGQEYLHKLYGVNTGGVLSQKDRFVALTKIYDAAFPGDRDFEVFSAPGRAEIGGNHTDHESGCVLVTAINLDTVGIVARNNDNVIHIHSEEYDPIIIHLDDLESQPNETFTSSALVRGICNYFHQSGAKVSGFNAALASTVPSGLGLSSSASFEILIAQILNYFFNHDQINYITLARAGQYAEVEYFKKPCGLMDQMASVVGGINSMDFFDPFNPAIRRVNNNLESSGYQLVITGTGDDHASLTEEYSSIIQENRAVAQYFHASALRYVNEWEFQDSLPALRRMVGDRAVLRAIHFFEENRRVPVQAAALGRMDYDSFLRMVNDSGQSSWTLLQNCYSCKTPSAQGITLGLTLSAQLLNGRGASRVHGGGFAGTLQAFVPEDQLNDYVAGMERVFGQGACYQLIVRPVGAIRVPIAE